MVIKKIVFFLLFQIFIICIFQIIYEYKTKKYEIQIRENNEKLKKVEEENFKLNKLNHEFFVRQKLLELKVETAIKNMNFEISDEIDLGDRILELSNEYKNKTINIKSTNLPKTNIEEIDDMFNYIQFECIKNKIEFSLELRGDIKYLIKNFINKNKLVTLIGDHLRDAIIAVNHSVKQYKNILVILGKVDDYYEFSIYDSGIEFEIEIFEKLGLEPVTTHKESGGTGIGFITTFETLRATDASLIIEEKNKLTENKYTKSIKFKFDNKKELKIISYRANDIRANLENNRFIIEQN